MAPSNGVDRVTATGSAPDASKAAAPVETEYLDLDRDGIPDAVRTTETVEYDGAEIVETVRELDSGIGDDGRPTTIEVSDTITIDTDHDGRPDVVEVARLTAHPRPESNPD